MALGKIDHLQHYFAREARRVATESTRIPSGSLPANTRHTSSLPNSQGGELYLPEEDEEDDDVFPQTPLAPVAGQQLGWHSEQSEKVLSWKEMRSAVWQEIDAVCRRCVAILNRGAVLNNSGF